MEQINGFLELERNNPYIQTEIPNEGLLILLPDKTYLTEIIVNSKPWQKPKKTEGLPISGHRRSYPFNLDGNHKIIVKHKGTHAEYEMFISVASEQDDGLRGRLYRIGSSTFSICKELETIEYLREKWRDTYNEELPIEKPIGGFVAKDGDKFIFFDYVPGEMPAIESSGEIEIERQAWMLDKVERIRHFGIEPNECDTLVIKDSSDKGYHFLLVDAEKWLRD